MTARYLTALPVFNEVNHVIPVLQEVRRFAGDILVVDDGSTDGTSQILDGISGISVAKHHVNKGYGAALRTAFDWAAAHGYAGLVTIDCDGQHEPSLIPELFRALDENAEASWDMVSGSRYLDVKNPGDAPPERRAINGEITAWLNQHFGWSLTDAFCGFKAYRVSSLSKLKITEDSYGMPLELWVQAAQFGWRLKEFPVPLVYLDEKRSFGGVLDDAERRRAYYYDVIDRALARETIRETNVAQEQACGIC